MGVGPDLVLASRVSPCVDCARNVGLAIDLRVLGMWGLRAPTPLRIGTLSIVSLYTPQRPGLPPWTQKSLGFLSTLEVFKKRKGAQGSFAPRSLRGGLGGHN